TEPWQRLYIRGNGEILPCCAMFAKYLSLGNITKNSLYELWNSLKMKTLRKLLKERHFELNKYCLFCSQN
ncbi:SPASM domain-containing protein, partial [Candidatus Gracilibacteria bacterium]|nr:SPASM domain-containing protein [Candidatus Gracilibacteria bacterium]